MLRKWFPKFPSIGVSALALAVSAFGQTWRPIGVEPPDTGQVLVLRQFGSVLYAGIASRGLFRSLDHGLTWTRSNGGKDIGWVSGLVRMGRLLFMATTNGLLRSEDEGVSWAEIRIPNTPPNPDFFSLGGVGSSLIATVEQSMPRRSGDSGVTWTGMREYLDFQSLLTSPNQFFTDGGVIYAGSTGMLRSLDEGLTWSDLSQSIPHPQGLYFNTVTAHGGILLTGTNRGAIFRSADNGESWTRTLQLDTTSWIFSLAVWEDSAARTATVFAGTYGSGVYRSPDGGVTWSPFISQGLPSEVTGLLVDGDRLFASAARSGLYAIELGAPDGILSSSGRGGASRTGPDRRARGGSGMLFRNPARGHGDAPDDGAVQVDGRESGPIRTFPRTRPGRGPGD